MDTSHYIHRGLCPKSYTGIWDCCGLLHLSRILLKLSFTFVQCTELGNKISDVMLDIFKEVG